MWRDCLDFLAALGLALLPWVALLALGIFMCHLAMAL